MNDELEILINGNGTNNSVYTGFQLAPIPNRIEKRLVDNGMLHYEASVAGFNERYRRGETSHTIHVWWARRPHSAMRSLVFASLSKDISESSIDTMAKLAVLNDKHSLEDAKLTLRKSYNEEPRLLDMFGGGGTIPFESKKLGINTFSIDSNELSVFIQRCNMEYADSLNINETVELVRKSGERVLNKLKNETNWLYPLREEHKENTFGYLWSYTKLCDHCGFKFYLIKRPWLSKKKDKSDGLYVVNLHESQELGIGKFSDFENYPFAWKKRSSDLLCPKCGSKQSNLNLDDCTDELLAIIQTSSKSGKTFKLVKETAIPEEHIITSKENELLDLMKIKLPSSKLPKWSGIVNPALYGMDTHADFLNRRQRLLLVYLIKILREEYSLISKSVKLDTAKFIIGVLSSLIDQIVDWNCRLSMWMPQNEQVGRAFCGPGVAMLWDYAETDQLLSGPANLWDKLERIIKGVRSFEGSSGKVNILKAQAQNLPFEDDYFDAIVTDPPYYDNIYYSILADFFYTWKKLLLEVVEPELFNGEITDYRFELVASSIRNENTKLAHERYCNELSRAFIQAARVLKPNGVFSFIYSHSSINGWHAIVTAYRQSPFMITSVQPLSIERKMRPRAILSEAINTCITFVARKNIADKKATSFSSVLEKMNVVINEFGFSLINQSGWSEADAGMATFAYGVGYLANAKEITGVTGDKEALIKLAKIVSDSFPSFSIKTRGSL